MTTNRERRWGRSALGAAGLALLLGCAVEDGPTGEVQTHLVSAIDHSQLGDGLDLRMDLRDARAVWVFDQTRGAIDYANILMVSPGGGELPMDDWLVAVDLTLGSNLRTSAAFSVGAASRGDVEAGLAAQLDADCLTGEDVCDQCVQCVQCGGHWVCYDRCAPAGPTDDRSAVERQRESGQPRPPEREPSSGSGGATPPPPPGPPEGSPPTPTPEPI